MRVILLFGFLIFKKNLRNKYYNHFLKLVAAVHQAENRTLNQSMIDNVKNLLRSFLIDYPKLYSPRHNSQTVHSLDHVGKTIEDYGPLTSYSTFHFEDILGTYSPAKFLDTIFRKPILGRIMRTIKGTRREDIEMIGNLNNFRNACFHLNDSTMDATMKEYIISITSGRGFIPTASHAVESMHPSESIEEVSSIFPDRTLLFYSTCKIGRNRLTTMEYASHKVADDSGVLIRLGDTLSFGLITAIFVDDDGVTFVRIWPLSCTTHLSIDLDTSNIDLPMIQEWILVDDGNYCYIPVKDVVEKRVHWRVPDTQKTMFFRFPNLQECSWGTGKVTRLDQSYHLITSLKKLSLNIYLLRHVNSSRRVNISSSETKSLETHKLLASVRISNTSQENSLTNPR